MDNTDRLLNKIISVLLFTVLLIMLTIGSIFIMPPSFASDNYAVLSNLDDLTTSILVSSGVSVLTSTDGTKSIYCGYHYGGSYTVNDVYAFIVLQNNFYYIYYVSHFDEQFNINVAQTALSSGSGSNYGGSLGYSDNSYNDYCYKFIRYVDPSTVTPNYTVYTSIEEAIDSINSSSITPSPATIIVRPGNVAYIGYDEGYCNLSVRLSSAVKSYSSNTRIGYSASRPAEGSTLYYDNSTGNSVSWVNSPPRDILGRSTYFIYHETFNSVGYFIIYNPAYDDAGNANNAISAEFSAYTSVVQFPLTTSLVDGSTVSTGNSDEFYMSQGEEMMSTPGVPTYIYTGTDGTTSSAIEVPASQYNYYAPEENEEGLLSGFVQRIVNLLSAPVKHIQNLFNEGLTFMTWLSGLWSWLPAEVVGILTSALVVLIVVGVIKVFWK